MDDRQRSFPPARPFTRCSFVRQARCSIALALLMMVAGDVGAEMINPPMSLASQSKVVRLVVTLIEKFHYLPRNLDEARASAALDAYLASLDPRHRYFLGSDIAEFKNGGAARALQALRKPELTFPDAIYQRYVQRVEERSRFVLTSLTSAAGDSEPPVEPVLTDTDRLPGWASDGAALDARWQGMLRLDLATAKALGLEGDQARGAVRDYYQRLAARVAAEANPRSLEKFLNAFVHTYDNGSNYFAPLAIEGEAPKDWVGVGATIAKKNGLCLVHDVVPAGPAAVSLPRGAVILGARDVSATGLTLAFECDLEALVGQLRGPEGSMVRVAYLEGVTAQPDPQVVDLGRAARYNPETADPIVNEIALDEGRFRVGVIKVPVFFHDLAAERRGNPTRSTQYAVENMVNQLAAKAMDGIVLDLRGNRSGSISDAAALAGLFVESQPLVQARARDGRIDVIRTAGAHPAWRGRLAVLVDNHTRGAGELVAACLADLRRAVTLGVATGGAGSSKNFVNLNQLDKSAKEDLGLLHIMSHELFRANGAGLQGQGMTPEILLDAGPPLVPEVNPEPASIAPARLEPAGTVPTDIAERLKATLPSNTDATASGDQDPAISAAARALTLLSAP